MSRVVYLIVCGAGPAPHAGEFIAAARAEEWDCHVITTPAGRGFVDVQALEEASGNPVISEHRRPGTPRRGRPPADAVVIAPATANTICKLAAGITDTYALDIASECIGLGVPTVVAPFVNAALAGRGPYRRAVAWLKEEGLRVVDVKPHEPHTGGERLARFPWEMALAEASRLSCRYLWPWWSRLATASDTQPPNFLIDYIAKIIRKQLVEQGRTHSARIVAGD